MSKINAIRMINVNYNNNSMKISDEIFQMQGKSTLMSLRNGGGKSVIVQMVTAPFVHKKYRNTADRPFDSYFTSMKPSFILVEWVLDGGAGYCLTGMMVRKNQNMEDLNDEKLEGIHFIASYKNRCEYDLFHLPVVERNGKEILLKSYRDCKQLFEMYKKEKTIDFQYYEMNNPTASRQYFQRLAQYQIYYKEWENIIRKVNVEESGLSKLFSDCKDEKELIEKWFLYAVENKLNGDSNRVKGFQEMVSKYVGQYRDNQFQMKKRENIHIFNEDAISLEQEGDAYLKKEQEAHDQRQKIRDLLVELHVIGHFLEEQEQSLLCQIQEKKQSLDRLDYEMSSAKVYDLLDTQREHTLKREMYGMEREQLQMELAQKTHKLQLLLCAKQNEKKREYEKEVLLLQEKKKIASEEEKNLAPERNLIGGKLKSYFQKTFYAVEALQEQTLKSLAVIHENLEVTKSELEQNQNNTLACVSQISSYKVKLEQYAKVEEQFNESVKETFTRNIMGEYEPGFLEISEKKFQKELEDSRSLLQKQQKDLESGKQRMVAMTRQMDEVKDQKRVLLMEQQRLQATITECKKVIEKKQLILRYLELSSGDLWNEEKIIEAAERKCKELEQIAGQLQIQKDTLEKEFQAFTTGKTMEIPQAIEKHFIDLEIQPIQGMEWLRKNGRTEEENQKLVENHPFLPYGLILSQKQIEQLKHANHEGIFSSFPIPIIERECLEEVSGVVENGIYHAGQIHFYMMFNRLLLNEEALNQVILQKKEELFQISEKLDIRKEEYKDALERAGYLKNQKLSKTEYDKLQQDLADTDRKIVTQDEQIEQLLLDTKSLENEQESLRTAIQELFKKLDLQENKVKLFHQLCKAYEQYRKDTELLHMKQEEKNRLERQKKLLEESLERGLEKQAETKNLSIHYEKQLDEIKEEGQKYAAYQEAAWEEEEQEVEQLKARYDAITSSFSKNLQDLEEQLQKESKHLQKEQKELEKMLKKYALQLVDVEQHFFQEEEEQNLEEAMDGLEKLLKKKDYLFYEEDKQVGIIESRMQTQKEEIFAKFHVDRLAPREEIEQVDYPAQMNAVQYQISVLQEQKDSRQQHLESVNENLAALAQFEDYEPEEIQQRQNIAVEESIYFQMDRKQLREQQGIMVRDLNSLLKERENIKGKVERLLHNLAMKKEYQDEDFSKCFMVLRESTQTAVLFLEQLHTILMSYDSLLKKLEVDLAMIEREREEVEGLLLDYIREVHKNLGYIDNNSTITVRNRPIKMLKLILPEWEEQEKMYEIRLQDMIKEITDKSMQLFDKNENPLEFITKHITTREMYDTIVGIGSIQIKLYKIEAEKEYPITWKDAARNSGGEGFLSAFVVLSCLLYYMRKDDMDFFADRNEGKILVMDNPFAQTSSEHLLRPLMDMAKKTNTQLICLSALGGDSIYSCFDNIYVLELMHANIHGGLRYMKGEHIRGNDESVMISSRVEVIGQQELLF